MHATTWQERDRVIFAFESSPHLDLNRRAQKIALCCVAPCLRVEKGRVPVVCPGRCRDRMCPLCSRCRGAVARERIRKLVLQADSLRMVTLTLPASTDTLAAVLDRLFDAFQRLRRAASWKQHVRGGLFAVEITRGANGDHWHVHMHVLVEGAYYHFKTLSTDWALALGAPAVVDIRAVHSRLQAAAYVTKYVSKGSDTRTWNDDTLAEFARDLHRRRLYGTFGKWHKADVARVDDKANEACPRHSVSLKQIIDLVRRGDLDPAHHAPRIAALGFVAQRMLGDLAPPPGTGLECVNAQTFEQLTLFALDLVGVLSHPHDEPPPEPPPPTASETHTLPLYSQHYV